MKTKIKLADINITHLSTEVINLLSKLILRIIGVRVKLTNQRY